jgi:Tfp pilus assembly protein FimV
LALSLLLVLPAAHPAGLGGHEVQSALGQPLRMVVQVTARPDETFDANCFKIHPFTVANDGLPQLTSAQVSLDRRGSQPRLVVSSTRPILDPIVRVSIDVGCDTTLRRDLTLLLDPLPSSRRTRRPRPRQFRPSAHSPALASPSAAAASSGGTGADPLQRATRRDAGAGRPTPGPAPRAGGQYTQERGATRPPRASGAGTSAAAQPSRAPRPVAPQLRDRLSISASGPP